MSLDTLVGLVNARMQREGNSFRLRADSVALDLFYEPYFRLVERPSGNAVQWQGQRESPGVVWQRDQAIPPWTDDPERAIEILIGVERAYVRRSAGAS